MVDLQRALAMAPAMLAVAWLVLACEPTVVIGTCSEPSLADADGGQMAASASAGAGAVGVPWSTGFEDGLCGYHSVQGYCYARHGASLEIVQSPTPHGGKFVAAFTVNADATTLDRSQTRCVRQGSLPASAYYSAWYFIPALQTSDGNWNLFHFLGATSAADSQPHALWDISLANDQNGKLVLSVLNSLTNTHPKLNDVGPIPIGSWFEIGIQLVRSNQPNGEVIVYQDEAVVVHLTDLVTDDTEWGQWYVGNYAKTLVPAFSKVYVDDISIREER